MRAMQRVGARRQHQVEDAAGPARHVAQEGAARAALVPVARDRDLRAVGEVEARDVDGAAERMLREPAARVAVARPAGIAAEMADAHDVLAEMPLRGGLQHQGRQ